jgi:hypothetical protein
MAVNAVQKWELAAAHAAAEIRRSGSWVCRCQACKPIIAKILLSIEPEAKTKAGQKPTPKQGDKAGSADRPAAKGGDDEAPATNEGGDESETPPALLE